MGGRGGGSGRRAAPARGDPLTPPGFIYYSLTFSGGAGGIERIVMRSAVLSRSVLSCLELCVRQAPALSSSTMASPCFCELEEALTALDDALATSWSTGLLTPQLDVARVHATQAHAAAALVVLLHRLSGSPAVATSLLPPRLQRCLERVHCVPRRQRHGNEAAQRFVRAALAGQAKSEG